VDFWQIFAIKYYKILADVTKIGKNELWKMSPVPLLIINLKVNTTLVPKVQKKDKAHKEEEKAKEAEKEKNKAKDEKGKEKSKEGDQEEKEGEKEAQKEKEKEKEPKVEYFYYSPSEKEIIEVLQRPFDLLVETTNSIMNLEKDLVLMGETKKGPAYPISKELPIILKKRQEIDEYVKKGFEEPNEILEKFKKYEFIVEMREKDLIKQVLGSSKEKPDIETLDKEQIEKSLRDLATAKKEISALANSSRNYRFFNVVTTSCKDDLINKTNDLIRAIE